MELIDQILLVLIPVLSIALGYFVGNNTYLKFKVGLADLTKIFVDFNNAMYDDKITTEEANQLWEDLKKMYFDMIGPQTKK